MAVASRTIKSASCTIGSLRGIVSARKRALVGILSSHLASGRVLYRLVAARTGAWRTERVAPARAGFRSLGHTDQLRPSLGRPGHASEVQNKFNHEWRRGVIGSPLERLGESLRRVSTHAPTLHRPRIHVHDQYSHMPFRWYSSRFSRRSVGAVDGETTSTASSGRPSSSHIRGSTPSTSGATNRSGCTSLRGPYTRSAG
jgi:hypothetical protein